ncbi:MAG TPA: hypothetical protein VFM63_02820 [Pyrinomonadaceae bacterium]|nr:hypothetical protein [Pyrinomonadaceae bacterium]
MKDKPQPKTPGARPLATRPGVPTKPSPLTRLQNSQPNRVTKPAKPTVASAPANPTALRPPGLPKVNVPGPPRAGLIQRKPSSVIQRSKDQRRFEKAWNATQSEDMRGRNTQVVKKTVPAKVLIISEGSHRDTGSLHEERETTVHRTYYPDPDAPQEIEKIQNKFKGKTLTPWDINKAYPLPEEKYDLIIARSSICFCLGNIYACGGYHSERQTLDALKQIANLLNTKKNPKARAYLTSGTLVSTAGPKTAPRHLKPVAPFDIRFPEVMPDPQPTFAAPDRSDARQDTENFWRRIPEKFNAENPDFVMLPIKMGTVNQDVNEKDPPGWLFGFKIKRLRKVQLK